MKRFCRNTIIFFIFLFLIASILDWLVTSQLRKSHGFEFGEWNAMFRGDINTDLVIYGSSRAWVHFNTRIIEEHWNCSAYNLGFDGQRFPIQYLRHKLLLMDNRKPKRVIVSLDFEQFQKPLELYHYEQFLPYLDNEYIRDETLNYGVFDWSDYYLPLIRYVGETKEIMHALKIALFPSANRSLKYKGFLGKEKKWNDDLRKIKTQYKEYRAGVDADVISTFEKFLVELKEEDIEVILVFSPVYIEGQEFVVNRHEIDEIIKGLCVKHKVNYFSFLDDPICTDQSLFYNANHMNSRGADLFTRALCARIDSSLHWKN